MLTAELVGQAIGRAMAVERLSPAELRQLQQDRLRELLRFTVEHSPFYRRHYAGIDIQHAPLAALPPVNKRMMQDNFDEVVTDRRVTLAAAKAFCSQTDHRGPPFYLGQFALLMSSGTTNERGYFVQDGAALAEAIATGYRQSNRGGDPRQPPAPQRIAAVMLIEPFDSAGMLMRLIPESVGPKLLIDIRQDLADVVQQLNDFQPTLLSSFPYLLRMLAEQGDAGKLRIAPQRITSSGDVLSASDRAAVRRAFGLEPYNYYCSTEFPYLAWEGDDHDGLYVNADQAIVESVDAKNMPVAPGQLGDKLLVTNLTNRAMPLIRYEMSDQVEFMPEGGGLAGPLPRIRQVAGRVEHLLSLPAAATGRVSLIPEHLDEYLGSLPHLVNYQVIQEDAARLTVNFVPRTPEAGAALRQALQDGLRTCFARYGVADNVSIDWRLVERLEPIRPGASKVCHYWNRWGG
ncbi:MAG: phenylacetate--CoA ligase family protein [Pirellulales bacterium]